MASAPSKTGSQPHQAQRGWSDTVRPRKPLPARTNLGTTSQFGKFLTGEHALARDFAPAMGDILPHSLLDLLLRARGPFIGQRGAREKPFLRDAFSHLHAIQLARRTGRSCVNLPVMVTAQRQIRNIRLWAGRRTSYLPSTGASPPPISARGNHIPHISFAWVSVAHRRRNPRVQSPRSA